MILWRILLPLLYFPKLTRWSYLLCWHGNLIIYTSSVTNNVEQVILNQREVVLACTIILLLFVLMNKTYKCFDHGSTLLQSYAKLDFESVANHNSILKKHPPEENFMLWVLDCFFLVIELPCLVSLARVSRDNVGTVNNHYHRDQNKQRMIGEHGTVNNHYLGSRLETGFPCGRVPMHACCSCMESYHIRVRIWGGASYENTTDCVGIRDACSTSTFV
jgi:hypothetical protein